MEKNTKAYTFPDHHQNFWQLASIQSASLGIPGIIIGGQLASQLGPGAAITSVILGNLILWMVGLTIITMAAPNRDNALQNINHYLGKAGGLFSAFFLILAFLSWYILQINSANIAISHLVSSSQIPLRLGAGLGALIALLSIGGIQLIKKFCVVVFPFLLIFVLSSISLSFSSLRLDSLWNFSFLGVVSVVSITLPGIVNLPTFFRHSRSNYDSYLGLSLMITFTIIFQIYSILAGFWNLDAITAKNSYETILLIGFIILSLVSVNLVNIYFASAGWEMIFPHRKSNKEFVIVGLLGTLAYTFLQLSGPMQWVLDVADNFIASLGIVLLLSFLMKTFAQHRPRPFEKMINFGCWFFGAILGTIFTSQENIESATPLIISFCATSIAYLCIIYIEETYWSIKNIISRTPE